MNERTLSKVLVIPTAIVVLIIAALLYRWSNQVSESTSVRLADSLQMSMVNWHLNFFRDLSDIAMAMRVDSESDSDQFARRFEEWRAAASYPEIVSHLYILKTSAVSGTPVYRLDAKARKFAAVDDWPPALTPLREELRHAGQTHTEFRDALYASGGLSGWRFEPQTPALLCPITSDLGDWLVVELNRESIQSRLLPDLANRYFMGVDGLDYLIAVVSGPAARQVIYSSDPGFGSREVTDADGRMDVFGEITARQYGSPIHVFHKLSETAGLSGLAASLGTSWFPLLGKPANDQGWQLIVRHRRGGALGAFVAEMHQRDLAISFGVLLMLVISVAMLIVTSLRANRLAKLQMDFVTTVSHELRSPLAIISSAAENIVHGVVGGREQLAQYGSVIEGQARRLSRLVEEVLLFAATRENRHRYDSRPLEVADIVEATLAGTADLIDASRFTVERDIPSGLPPVRGDLAALSQCLQNLITNALKYSGGERWIGIRAGVHEDGPTNGREVRISVSDHGIGIAPADLPRIFEPFYRSSSATAGQIHGTGLGLSLAKNIAEAMQGQLTVVSERGRGTTFTLHLPCRADASTPPAEQSAVK